MAGKKTYLDVWIVESNTVYQEVPFTVVADWVQQGRLLEDDQVKPSGTKDWQKLAGSPDFSPYLPKPEPFRANDQAEALEPVQIDFAWKKHRDEEDDDVDMIPLIDVSLVLLIFFMLTASSVGTAAFVPTPPARTGTLATGEKSLLVVIRLDDGDPVYSVHKGNNKAAEDDNDIRDFHRLLDAIHKYKPKGGPIELQIDADRDLQSSHTRLLLAALQTERFRGYFSKVHYGVSEKQE
jgi:biopolymer transport protein ExbD